MHLACPLLPAGRLADPQRGRVRLSGWAARGMLGAVGGAPARHGLRSASASRAAARAGRRLIGMADAVESSDGIDRSQAQCPAGGRWQRPPVRRLRQRVPLLLSPLVPPSDAPGPVIDVAQATAGKREQYLAW